MLLVNYKANMWRFEGRVGSELLKSGFQLLKGLFDSSNAFFCFQGPRSVENQFFRRKKPERLLLKDLSGTPKLSSVS